MNERQLAILEELLNNEIEEYLQSGYKLNNDYVVELRQFLKDFNLKEYYNYDEWS